MTRVLNRDKKPKPVDSEVEMLNLVVAGAGKHSGRNALKTKLHSLGFELAQDQLDDVFKRFKVCSSLLSGSAISFVPLLG